MKTGNSFTDFISSKEYGRFFVVTETEAEEIKDKNKKIKASEKHKLLEIRRRIENYQINKELGLI